MMRSAKERADYAASERVKYEPMRGPLKRHEEAKTMRAEAMKPDHKGTWMKDGGMDRSPRPESHVKVFKHGDAQTIKPGGVTGKPMSDGMHGLKLDAKARAAKAREESMPTMGAVKRVEVHHYSATKGK